MPARAALDAAGFQRQVARDLREERVELAREAIAGDFLEGMSREAFRVAARAAFGGG